MSSPCFRVWIWLMMLLLSACSPDKPDESQQFYFGESLTLVENAGRQLQRSTVEADEIQKALADMDRGISLAFQVEAVFLDQFDPRLSKNYQRYFVKGIEAYRLGIEAGDAEQQKNGLQLLSKWAAFWAEAKDSITEKMQAK